MEYLEDPLDVRDVFSLLLVRQPWLIDKQIVGWKQGKRWWSISLQNEDFNLTLRGLVKKTRRSLSERASTPEAPDAGGVGADPEGEGSLAGANPT